MLSSSAGSTASLVNLTLISSLCGAVYGNAALAGIGIAAAVYLSPHNLILLVSSCAVQSFPVDVWRSSATCSVVADLQVPLTLLLERVNNGALLADDAASTVSTDDTAQHTAMQASAKQQLCRAARPVILYCALFLACLVIMSDIQLRHYPEHYEMSCAQLFFPRPIETPNLSRPVGACASAHWTRHVYGYMFCVSQPPANEEVFHVYFCGAHIHLPLNAHRPADRNIASCDTGHSEMPFAACRSQ